MSPNDLARICDINSSQMRQYVLGIKQPSDKTISRIKERTRQFAETLKDLCLP